MSGIGDDKAGGLRWSLGNKLGSLVYYPCNIEDEFNQESDFQFYNRRNVINYKKGVLASTIDESHESGSFDFIYDYVKDGKPKRDIYTCKGYPCRSAWINEYLFYRATSSESSDLEWTNTTPQSPLNISCVARTTIYKNGKQFYTFGNPVLGFCIIEGYLVAFCSDKNIRNLFYQDWLVSNRLSVNPSVGYTLSIKTVALDANYELLKNNEGELVSPVNSEFVLNDTFYSPRSFWAISRDLTKCAYADLINGYLYRGNLVFNENKYDFLDQMEKVEAGKRTVISTEASDIEEFGIAIANITANYFGYSSTIVDLNCIAGYSYNLSHALCNDIGSRAMSITKNASRNGTLTTTCYIDVYSGASKTNYGDVSVGLPIVQYKDDDDEPIKIDTLTITEIRTCAASNTKSWQIPDHGPGLIEPSPYDNTSETSLFTRRIIVTSPLVGLLSDCTATRDFRYIHSVNTGNVSGYDIQSWQGDCSVGYTVKKTEGGGFIGGEKFPTVSFSGELRLPPESRLSAIFDTNYTIASGTEDAVYTNCDGYYANQYASSLSKEHTSDNQAPLAGPIPLCFVFTPNETNDFFDMFSPLTEEFLEGDWITASYGSYLSFKFNVGAFSYSKTTEYSLSSESLTTVESIVGVDYKDNDELLLKIVDKTTSIASEQSTQIFSGTSNSNLTGMSEATTSITGNSSSTVDRQYSLYKNDTIVYDISYKERTNSSSWSSTATLNGFTSNTSVSDDYLYNDFSPVFLDARHDIYWFLHSQRTGTNINNITLSSCKLIEVTSNQYYNLELDVDGFRAIRRSSLPYDKGNGSYSVIFPCGSHSTIFSGASLSLLNKTTGNYVFNHCATISAYSAGFIPIFGVDNTFSAWVDYYNAARYQKTYGWVWVKPLIDFHVEGKISVVLVVDGQSVTTTKDIHTFYPIQVQ